MLTRVDDLGRVGHQRRRMGCGRAAQPVHGELLLGMGRAVAHDARTSTPARRCRARCSTRCSPRRISRAACRCCARSSSRCSTCCCTPTTIRRRGASDAAGVLDAGAARSRGRAAARRTTASRTASAHIFAGGYAAGLLQLQVGRGAVRRCVSACSRSAACCRRRSARASATRCSRVGGSRPALESFVAFRGRPPQLDALLRHNGMVET